MTGFEPGSFDVGTDLLGKGYLSHNDCMVKL